LLLVQAVLSSHHEAVKELLQWLDAAAAPAQDPSAPGAARRAAAAALQMKVAVVRAAFALTATEFGAVETAHPMPGCYDG
jgi:hypothetical protein